MIDPQGNKPPGWPDVLESDGAAAVGAREYPDSFMLELYDLFDKMEREIRVHRLTYCTTQSRTHKEAKP